MSVRYESRMSDSDALLWNNERDPMLRSTILAIMILDTPPDATRAAQAIDRSLARIPRLRQRVALDPFAVALPRWENDPHFDLGYPVRRLRAPGAGRMRDLLRPARVVGGTLNDAFVAAVLGGLRLYHDFVTSNVPGPPFPVYMSGARVERMFGFGPLSGAAINVTLFSYDGSACFTINSDPAAVPDPEFLSECLGKGVAEVLSVG